MRVNAGRQVSERIVKAEDAQVALANVGAQPQMGSVAPQVDFVRTFRTRSGYRQACEARDAIARQ